MAIVYHKSKSTKYSVYSANGSGGSTEIAYQTDSSRNTVGKVSGSWITFPDGSRFRRATDYAHSSCVATRGDNYEWNGIRNVNRWINIIRSGPGGFQLENMFSGNFIYRLDGSFGINSTIGHPSFVLSEENEAITKALNNLGDQKVNLGENLATLGQTVRMLKNPLWGFVNLARSMRKRKEFRGLLEKSYRDLRRDGIDRAIASKYLEYVYGFKPLMSDIHELSELAKSKGQSPLLLSATGRSTRMLSNSNTGYNEYQQWENIRGQSKTRTNLWARVDPNYRGTRTLNQLGLLNPASLAWELVPYSFCVDWILPIGPVLQALTAPAGLLFVNGSTSRRVHGQWDYVNWASPGSGYTVRYLKKGNGSFRYEGYRRKGLTSWPRPGLWFDPDPLRLNNDKSDRAFKALAVAIMSLPRK